LLTLILAVSLVAGVVIGQQSDSNSLTRSEKDGKWGFVNTAGKFVVPAQFDWVSDFSEGLARVKMGVTVSRTGMTLGKHSDNNWRYIDKSGNTVFKLRADSVGDFSEGLASACIIKRDGYLYCGYIDKQGRWAIEPTFGSCEPFTNGIAKILLNGQWRWIDRQGKFIAGR